MPQSGEDVFLGGAEELLKMAEPMESSAPADVPTIAEQKVLGLRRGMIYLRCRMLAVRDLRLPAQFV